ncbi:MAG: hypothetical protein K5780_01125 [Alphaproteobacteria bacterium]|nr:hypothetical protein [Alphaproteobacteria bacterium]
MIQDSNCGTDLEYERIEEYLCKLEEIAKNSDLKNMYLWPRTPDTKTHQDKIIERIGVSDWEDTNPVSRPYKVIKELKRLLKSKKIKETFSLVDITCGDAIVLSKVKKAFPYMHAYGVDCFKDRFETHQDCYKQGIKIYKGYIQDMFNRKLPENTKFDAAIMFNSYRGWRSADLKDYEKDLPDLADDYFANQVRFTFLTATKNQIKQLKKIGFSVKFLGNGEDDSLMIVITRNEPLFCNVIERIINYAKMKIYIK